MADSKFSLDSYIDVAERIVNFMEAFPDGSLQQYVPWETREVAGQTFIVYTAAAYRTPDDRRPGIGTAWEPFPGTTPYTRNSELMNAETAAWGRAIVACGLTANRKIASRQEVQARAEEQGNGTSTAPAGRVSQTAAPTDRQLALLKSLVSKEKPPEPVLKAMLRGVGADGVDPMVGGWSKALNRAQVSQLIEVLKSGALPTGESDLPSDLEGEDPDHRQQADDLPFDAVGAEQS